MLHPPSIKQQLSRRATSGLSFTPIPTKVHNILFTTRIHPLVQITMQFFTTIALILAAAMSVYAAALPTPSGAPKCSYNCPGSDKKDWKLVGSHSLTSHTMRCDYFPFDFDMTPATCTYDTTVSRPAVHRLQYVY
jgi:hypothetical protein